MITIKVTYISIEATGHANYGKPGEDIICSAVSTLMQTLELRGMATIKEKGNMKVICEDRPALELITEGLNQIERNYPGYVEVIEC